MKRVLYVADYDPWRVIASGDMPKHHLYGFAGLVEKIEQIGGTWQGRSPDNRLQVTFYKFDRSSGRSKVFSLLWVLRNQFRYDVIYDMSNSCSRWVGILKKYGLFRPKLITILHHPPYERQLKYAKSDVYIFFSKGLRNTYRHRMQNACIQYWAPDISWYEANLPRAVSPFPRQSPSYFIDSGKTDRDRTTLVRAAALARQQVLLQAQNGQEKDSEYVRYFTMDHPNDLTMLGYLRGARCIVIPLKKCPNRKTWGPLGATSFLDAIALRLPVIVSDTFYLARLVKKFGVGLVYEAENERMLGECMRRLGEDEEMYERMRGNYERVREEISLERYTERVREMVGV